MNIELGNLKEGEYRKLKDEELNRLYELIKDSSNETVIPTGKLRVVGGKKNGK